MNKKHYTYLVRCNDGSYYCGYAVDVVARVETHNKGAGAKYTRCRRPVSLVYTECFDTKSEAMSRECAIKKLTHTQKAAMVQAYAKRKEDER